MRRQRVAPVTGHLDMPTLQIPAAGRPSHEGEVREGSVDLCESHIHAARLPVAFTHSAHRLYRRPLSLRRITLPALCLWHRTQWCDFGRGFPVAVTGRPLSAYASARRSASSARQVRLESGRHATGFAPPCAAVLATGAPSPSLPG